MNGNNDAILGYCNMVLAISQDTINYQFEELSNQGIIREDWNIVVVEEEEENKTEVYVNLTENEFNDLIKEEDFDYAFNAIINTPTVEILQETPKEVLFTIPFVSGTMYYWMGHGRKAKLTSIDMAGWKYAFKVFLARVNKDVKDTNWIENSEQSFQETIKNIGLPQELFTIESLFIDFENTNYADYDPQKSHVPVDISELATFQNILSNYLKSLRGEKNPYILGYAPVIKEIKNQEKALFQPTALRYSTSYNSDPSMSAFNFLMMIDNQGFPDRQDVGILPKSLIKSSSSEVDGALGIDFNLFYEKYLLPFLINIQKSLQNSFKEISGKGKSGNIFFGNYAKVTVEGNDTLSFSRKGVSVEYSEVKIITKTTLQNPDLEREDKQYGVDMSFRPLVTFSAQNNKFIIDFSLRRNTVYHDFKPDKILHPFIFSLEAYKSNYENGGVPDGFIIYLQPESLGGVHITIDRKSGKEKDVFTKDEHQDLPNEVLRIMTYEDIDILNKVVSVIKDGLISDQVMKSLAEGIKSFPNVILPLNKVYTYKNIDLDEQDAVTFQTSYAPVIE